MDELFKNPDNVVISLDVSKENSAQISKEIASSESVKDAMGEVENKQSGRSKILAKVKEMWGKIQPVVVGLTTAFTVATAFVKSVTKFITQCKSMKGVVFA